MLIQTAIEFFFLFLLGCLFVMTKKFWQKLYILTYFTGIILFCFLRFFYSLLRDLFRLKKTKTKTKLNWINKEKNTISYNGKKYFINATKEIDCIGCEFYNESPNEPACTFPSELFGGKHCLSPTIGIWQITQNRKKT